MTSAAFGANGSKHIKLIQIHFQKITFRSQSATNRKFI